MWIVGPYVFAFNIAGGTRTGRLPLVDGSYLYPVSGDTEKIRANIVPPYFESIPCNCAVCGDLELHAKYWHRKSFVEFCRANGAKTQCQQSALLLDPKTLLEAVNGHIHNIISPSPGTPVTR